MGTYTNIAKRRAEQSKEAVTVSVSPMEQASTLPTPTPLPKPVKRKQISAYLTLEQLQKLKSLHFMLNINIATDNTVEKSDIVALGIEALSILLGTQVPEYSNIQELRSFVLNKIPKYSGT